MTAIWHLYTYSVLVPSWKETLRLVCSGLLDVDSALESHLKHPKEVVLSNNGTASIAVYYHRPSQQIIVSWST